MSHIPGGLWLPMVIGERILELVTPSNAVPRERRIADVLRRLSHGPFLTLMQLGPSRRRLPRRTDRGLLALQQLIRLPCVNRTIKHGAWSVVCLHLVLRLPGVVAQVERPC